MKNSDILDRWTILLMKARLDQDAAQELVHYDMEVTKFFNASQPILLIKSIMKLQEANAKIWVLEASIRKEYGGNETSDELSDAEIGRRCLRIRGYNKLRLEAKKAIALFFGEIPDVKVEHASASIESYPYCDVCGGIGCGSCDHSSHGFQPDLFSPVE